VTRRTCAVGALAIFAAVTGKPAPAQPPGHANPPTYDCEPGTPDPKAKTCHCPDGFEPHIHENKVPFCRKLPARPKLRSRSKTS